MLPSIPTLKHRTERRRSDDSGRAFRLIVAIVTVLTLGITGSPAAARWESLSARQAEVIVQQSASLPSGEIGWRVVRLDAQPAATAPMAERSLGFVVPDEDLLVVTDEATGDWQVIGPGGALPVAQGDIQQRASVHHQAVPYYGLELVAAVDLTNPATIGRADLLFAGEPFAAPIGERRLTLSHDRLAPGETVTGSPATAPRPGLMLVLVTAGELRVDGRATLATGEAGTYPSGVALEAGERGATVAVAAIAEQTTGPVGVFAVETFACPAGMSAQTFAMEACSVADEALIDWTLAGDRFAALLTTDDAARTGATVRWDGLTEGAYFLELTATAYAVGFDDYLIPSSDQVTRQDERTTRLYRHTGFVRPITAYVFRSVAPVAAAGSFAVETYGCPPGMDQQSFEPADCALATQPLAEWSLTSDQFAGRLTLADAVVADGTVTWTGLPAGDYFVELTADVFRYGHDDYFVPSGEEVTRRDARTTRIYHRDGGERVVAYVFLAGGGVLGGNVITLAIKNCPPDTLLVDLQVQPCAEPIGAVAARLVCGDDGARLTLTDAIFDGRSFTWGNLPARECFLTFSNLPDGHDRVAIMGTGDTGLVAADEDYPLLIQEGGLALTAYLLDVSTPGDRDGDGLTDANEETLGTDPDTADSDGDGVSDFAEVRFGSDPLNPASRPD